MEQPWVVRSAHAERLVEDWILALTAVGVAARGEWSPEHGHLLVVDACDAQRASAVLEAYDDENRPRPVPPPPMEYGSGAAAVIVTAAICGLFVFTGPRADAHPWFAAGGADAHRILEGEWWRAATALTLHDDFLHVLSNAVALLVFGSALCALVGPGAGLWLLLLSGTGGNLLNVALRGAPYSGLGASTAIFGALGALGGIRAVQRHMGAAVSRSRTWAPFAAALGLLGMLGSSARSDVIAHLFGFLLGAALGAALTRAAPRPFGPRTQVALAGWAALALLGAWVVALRAA